MHSLRSRCVLIAGGLGLAALCAQGCSTDASTGPLDTDSGAPADSGWAQDTGVDTGIDTGVDTGVMLDSGAPPDTGVMCSMTLADTACPATYPINANSSCGHDATRAVMCGQTRALYMLPGFGATTCCYDSTDTLVGATVRSDIGDECYRETGIGPAATLGAGCCLASADTSCPDAGPSDTGSAISDGGAIGDAN